MVKLWLTLSKAENWQIRTKISVFKSVILAPFVYYYPGVF